jgi:hypothetical protein
VHTRTTHLSEDFLFKGNTFKRSNNFRLEAIPDTLYLPALKSLPNLTLYVNYTSHLSSSSRENRLNLTLQLARFFSLCDGLRVSERTINQIGTLALAFAIYHFQTQFHSGGAQDIVFFIITARIISDTYSALFLH